MESDGDIGIRDGRRHYFDSFVAKISDRLQRANMLPDLAVDAVSEAIENTRAESNIEAGDLSSRLLIREESNTEAGDLGSRLLIREDEMLAKN